MGNENKEGAMSTKERQQGQRRGNEDNKRAISKLERKTNLGEYYSANSSLHLKILLVSPLKKESYVF